MRVQRHIYDSPVLPRPSRISLFRGSWVAGNKLGRQAVGVSVPAPNLPTHEGIQECSRRHVEHGGLAVPKKHPDVTPATAKALYANAVRCAEPGCSDPLYRVDPDGNRVLNSRIAHICAKSEGGPRWDPTMDSATNQGVGNLVVLCRFHADLIDKLDLVHRYPVAMLHEWKAAQIAEYDAALAAPGSGNVGWRLTEPEAEEVVAKSEGVVNVTADTIYVGGMGGGPLGAGGGGGVIGGGIAGRGGDAPKIVLHGQPGQCPGGGGGGGGVMFDPVAVRGAPRADTGVCRTRVVDDDTSVAYSPDSAGALRLSALLLANYITTDRGLVHMINGGWESWTAPEIPASLTVPVLCISEAGRLDTGTYWMAVELRGPDGERRDRKSIEVVVEQAGTLVRAPVAVALSTTVGADDLGLWHVVVEAGGRELGGIELLVKGLATGDRDGR